MTNEYENFSKQDLKNRLGVLEIEAKELLERSREIQDEINIIAQEYWKRED